MKTLKDIRSGLLSEERDETQEKVEMAETQLHFIHYAAKEILEYIEMDGEIEEWYQNKLSKVHSDVESLHSYVEGEKRRTGMVAEELEQLDEIGNTPDGKKKLVQYADQGKLTHAQYWEKVAQKHLRDLTHPYATERQKDYARRCADKALKASKMRDPERAYRHYMDEEAEQVDEQKLKAVFDLYTRKNIGSKGMNAIRLVNKHGTKGEKQRTNSIIQRYKDGNDASKEWNHMSKMHDKYANVGNTKKPQKVDEGAKEDAAELLGGPVKEKPKMPPGKQPAGYRYVRRLARRAMKTGMKKYEGRNLQVDEGADKVRAGDVKKAIVASGAKHHSSEKQIGAHVLWFRGSSVDDAKKSVEKVPGYKPGSVSVEKNPEGLIVARIHKNELSRAGLDQGLAKRGGPGSPWSTRR